VDDLDHSIPDRGDSLSNDDSVINNDSDVTHGSDVTQGGNGGAGETDHAAGRGGRTEPGGWNLPLEDCGWDGAHLVVGEVELFVSTKRWLDGTVDLLVSADPFPCDGGMPTAFAHRHGAAGVPSLSAHGPGDLVVSTITVTWGSP
jgi:hypothetical protein